MSTHNQRPPKFERRADFIYRMALKDGQLPETMTEEGAKYLMQMASPQEFEKGYKLARAREKALKKQAKKMVSH